MSEFGQHGASTCPWAVATLSLAAPAWLDAETAPWTCVRGAAPRVLETTDECVDCPRRTAPAGRTVRPEPARRTRR